MSTASFMPIRRAPPAENVSRSLVTEANGGRCGRETYSITRFTSGYATMVHGRGRNPHRSTTTFAKLEITSLMTS